jgi:cysteine desulfurase NifS
MFRIRERLIEPVGEARSDFFIIAGLAERLGYGHLYPQTEEELLRHVLKGSGFTLEAVRAAGGTVSVETEMMQYRKWEKGLLRPDGLPGFDTPSGKFEIVSTVLEEFGYDGLPVYTEPSEGPLSRPDLLETYPLVLNSGGRVRTTFHTQHHGVRALSSERPEPTVMINREDAEERGIGNGDKVMIRSPRGSVTMRAIVTDDIVKGSIDANHAGGGPLGPKAWQECNINDLTDLDNFDPISGFPVYKALLCDVMKVDDEGSPLVLDSGDFGEDEVGPAEHGPAVKSVYLDHNATTPLAPGVKEYMRELMDVFGNPSSIHTEGKRSRRVLEEARRRVAQQLNCTARRLVFTGCGSESCNLAVKGAAAAQRDKGDHIVTSSIEHSSVLNTCRWLEKNGFRVTYLPVDQTGRVDPGALGEAIEEKTILVSVMLANNETGTIQPVRELASIARDRGILFHTDAVQALGRIPVDVEDLGVDMLSLSSHKVHGPKGVGVLFMRSGVCLESLIHGGGHERGIRSGTENTTGIAGFGKAIEMVPLYIERMGEVRKLRDELEDGIGRIIEPYSLNGSREHRLPNTLNVTLPGFRGESIVLEMDKRGVRFASGSACHSGSPEPSHALLAMGLTAEEAHCALRFSLGYGTCEDDIDRTLKLLEEVIHRSKHMVRFVACK